MIGCSYHNTIYHHNIMIYPRILILKLTNLLITTTTGLNKKFIIHGDLFLAMCIHRCTHKLYTILTILLLLLLVSSTTMTMTSVEEDHRVLRRY